MKTASAPRYATAHGIGIGNINGNGRMDIVNAFGWWERPQTGSTDGPWKYYPQTFARYGRNIMGGTVMAVYDVNGDRLNDVVPVLNAQPGAWRGSSRTRTLTGTTAPAPDQMSSLSI